ncbi:hypothetical protein [Sinorhizobium sp. BJ1]|uniref:hypothetical protein n=1 Tax=Sinorhizobium sp. BJ1 TaxID=2035455 RepID=UPI001FE20102|nr:hypothetical protein [Sinorhizobium sp. BJ1]
MRFLRSLTNAKTGFPVNGRGWTIRVTGKDPKGEWKDQPGVLGNALRLAADASGQTVEKPKTQPEASAVVGTSLIGPAAQRQPIKTRSTRQSRACAAPAPGRRANAPATTWRSKPFQTFALHTRAGDWKTDTKKKPS